MGHFNYNPTVFAEFMVQFRQLSDVQIVLFYKSETDIFLQLNSQIAADLLIEQAGQKAESLKQAMIVKGLITLKEPSV